MGQSTYFLTLGSAGNVTGSGFTPDGTLPPGAIICTETEAQNSARCTVSGTTVTLNPAPAPTLAQQGAAAIAAGLTIKSTATPALDGLYDVTDAAQARVNRISVYLQQNGTFPNAATTITWVDKNGGKHTFDATQFKTMATAIGDYVAALDDAMLGLSSALPPATAQIP